MKIITKQEFLETLDLYLAELGEDSCYRQARDYYASRPASHELRLDRLGSPAAQLRADARASGHEFLAEMEETMRRAPVFVWRPGLGGTESHYRPDHFTGAVRRIVAAFDPPQVTVVTLDGGVKQGLEGERAALVEEWRQAYRAELERYRAECRRTGVKGYKELSLFTFVGFFGGLVLGAVLDALGLSTSAIGEWAVRTLSGEGEDLAEGAWVLRSKLRRRERTQAEAGEAEDELEEEGFVWFEEEEAAEAYGTGKVVGMAFPWAVDAVSRLAGIDVRAPEGSYVAYFYSLADQLFATLNGLRYHVRRAGSFGGGVRGYFHDPVMVASFTVTTLPLVILFLVRSAGWRPDLLVLAAIEAILLNLCWVPPLTAWFWDRHLQRGLREITETYAARARATAHQTYETASGSQR
jgi:hypothetical protein